MSVSSHEPLFDCGIHDIDIKDLFGVCVKQFNNNEYRRKMFERFATYYWMLSELDLYCELWIDGSFVTKKEQPKDIDIVLIVNRSHLNYLNEDNARSFYSLTDPIAALARYFIDVRVHDISEHKRKAEKKELFLSDKNGRPKGFARLKLFQKLVWHELTSDVS